MRPANRNTIKQRSFLASALCKSCAFNSGSRATESKVACMSHLFLTRLLLSATLVVDILLDGTPQ